MYFNINVLISFIDRHWLRGYSLQSNNRTTIRDIFNIEKDAEKKNGHCPVLLINRIPIINYYRLYETN